MSENNKAESNNREKSLSYRDAGVDIDAGNQFIDKIRKSVASTIRPEVLGGLGGFGHRVR